MTTQRPSSATALALCGGCFALLMGAAWYFDPRLVEFFRAGDVERLKISDWYQFLRAFGYLPTWLVVAGAMLLVSVSGRRRTDPGGSAGRLRAAAASIVVSPLIAGLLAEILKRLVGRLRPAGDNAHRYKGLFRAFTDDANLGMPSSHTAVAFGAAWMVARLAPAPGILVLVLATGCGLTRLLAGAHYTTDVLAGVAIGYAGGAITARIFRTPGPRGHAS